MPNISLSLNDKDYAIVLQIKENFNVGNSEAIAKLIQRAVLNADPKAALKDKEISILRALVETYKKASSIFISLDDSDNILYLEQQLKDLYKEEIADIVPTTSD